MSQVLCLRERRIESRLLIAFGGSSVKIFDCLNLVYNFGLVVLVKIGLVKL